MSKYERVIELSFEAWPMTHPVLYVTSEGEINRNPWQCRASVNVDLCQMRALSRESLKTKTVFEINILNDRYTILHKAT